MSVIPRTSCDARRPRSLLLVVAATVALVACGGQTTGPSPAGSAPASSDVATSSPGLPGPSPEPSSVATPASQAPSAGAGDAYDACGLLPADALARIVGAGAQGNVMAGSDWMAAQCAWNTADSSFLLSVGTPASIAASGDPAAPDAAALLAAYRLAAGASGKATDLAGVGDAAVQSAAGVAIVKNGAYVELQVMGPALKGDQLVQIAKLAAAGL